MEQAKQTQEVMIGSEIEGGGGFSSSLTMISFAQNIMKGKSFMKSRLKLLSFIADAGLATNEDARNLCFGNSVYGDKCARRLTLGLENEGLLVSFETKAGVGRNPKVFAINKKRKQEIMDITGKSSIRIIEPGSNFHVKHQLCLNSVLVSFLDCCDRSKFYKCEFITDLEGTGRKSDALKAITEKEYLPYWGKVVFVPDAVVCVTNVREKKKALFFLEMDRETTTLKKIGGKEKNVQTKIKAYGSLWGSEKFKKYNEVFDYKFSGFRLLWVAMTQRRIDAVSKFCGQEFLGDSAWLSTISEIESRGVFGKIWTLPENSQKRNLVKEAK